MPSQAIFRELQPADVDAGLRLCRLSRWNQVRRDWEQFLRLEPHGASVALVDGRVIGTVATMRYGTSLAWIAMVLVDPAQRRQGIGTALLRRGLATLAGVPSVGLDATPAGEPLYRKLGFVETYRLKRLQRAAGSPGPAPCDDAGVRPLRPDDWTKVIALDRQASGVDRSAMLRWLAEGAPEYAWVAGTTTLAGFVLGRHGHDFDQLGPIAATTDLAARALACQALARRPERAFVVDAPDPQPGWQDWLCQAGFHVQRPFARMYRGRPTHDGCPSALFATIGPEFG